MEGTYDAEKGTVKMWTSQKNVYEYIKKAKYSFPTEVITRYFLSLKTKPFVILTGISGTGKTKIAQVFADYMCQDDTAEERAKRIAFVSVKPDWMDSRGLLGYYNLLDEKYHATAVLKLLLRADKNLDKPYFVILDEMNLAKVEQYFSDFLSIMESRTPGNPRGESLPLHPEKTAETKDGIPIPPSLQIPPNVYFAGTVNVDESTYMFSPKVLDRANVIEFNDVNLTDYLGGSEQSKRFVLRDPDVKKILLTEGEPRFCSMQDCRKALDASAGYEGLLHGILDILYPYNLHFGYRVINEISRFVINAAEMVEDFNIDDTFDVQLLQKILPKFHGSQARLDEPLRKLLSFCYRGTPEVFEMPDIAGVEKAIENGDIRFPRSARKLSRMLRNLKTQGYASFIE